MNKVILLNPNSQIIDREKDFYSIMEHLGLGLLSAVLDKNNFIVKIIDGYAHNLSNKTIIKKIKNFQPDFLGLTCNYINFENAIEIAKTVYSYPNPPFIFLGGEHCTYSAEFIIKNYPFIKAVVRGEAEVTIVELLKNSNKMNEISGIYFIDPITKQVIKNQDRPAKKNLDELPFARRDTLTYCLENKKTTAIGILAQRGCNSDCRFCNAHNFFRLGGGDIIRSRTPKNVADELEILYKKYYEHGNVEKIYYYDANFITGSKASKKWAEELAYEIINRDIIMPFEIYLRGDSISGNDIDLITLLKKAGLESVFIGIESFDQEALDVFNKKITVKATEDCLKILLEHEILGPTQGVIMFNPYSSYNGLKKTAGLLLKYNIASFWNLSQKLQIFPGVKLIEKLKQEGLLVGYDKTHKVYSYSFKIPEIEQAADLLFEMNNEEAVIKDNSLPRHIKTELKKISSELKVYNTIYNHFLKKRDFIYNELYIINKINVEFFLVYCFRQIKQKKVLVFRALIFKRFFG